MLISPAYAQAAAGGGGTDFYDFEGDNWVVAYGWRPEHPPG